MAQKLENSPKNQTNPHNISGKTQQIPSSAYIETTYIYLSVFMKQLMEL